MTAMCSKCGKNEVEKEGMLCDDCGVKLVREIGRAVGKRKGNGKK